MVLARQALLVVPIFVAVTTLCGPGSRFLRRLATDCINNVYSTPENAINIPVIPPTSTETIPAYIALCQVGGDKWTTM